MKYTDMTMRSAIPFCTFLSFLLLACSSNARNDPGEYWRDVMKDEAMPEAIQKLLHAEIGSSLLSEETINHNLIARIMRDKQQLFKNMEERKNFAVKDLRPKPNISVYHDDEKVSEGMDKNLKRKAREDVFGQKEETPAFAKDFKAEPMISIYRDK